MIVVHRSIKRQRWSEREKYENKWCGDRDTQYASTRNYFSLKIIRVQQCRKEGFRARKVGGSNEDVLN